MTFPPPGGNGFVSVDELVGALPRLALPHFQRGHVWKDDSVSRLLESFMLDTPCGSIIVWVPEGRIQDYGENVAAWGTEHPDFLVVDGQQRLTALANVWHSDMGTAPAVWAFNLAAFRDLRLGHHRHRLESREAFVPMSGTPPESASATARRNYEIRTRRLIPLPTIAADGEAAWRQRPSSGPAAQQWAQIVDGIRRIPGRRMQVVVKRGTPLSEVVSLYNRINSSGVVVRKEERAFATMVSIEPDASSWLRDCFHDTHPPLPSPRVAPADTSARGRDTVMQPRRERQFGFSIFISAYAQTVGHHRQGRTDLDQLARTEPDVSWANEDRDLTSRLLTESQRIVTTTARVLRDVLGCDDYRFLPSASPLRPVFTLLLKYPTIDDDLIAAAILSLQVHDQVGRDGSKRIDADIANSNSLGEAMAAFPSTGQLVGDQQQFAGRLDDVTTVGSAWVSLLYWYQRSRGARDYLATAVDGGTGHIALGRAALAQKEHIIPFSQLYGAFGAQPRDRSRDHPINAIGNLTLLSAAANTVHWDALVALDSPSVPRDLLVAHDLADTDVMAAYSSTIALLSTVDAAEGSPEAEAVQRAYERFRRLRTRRLASGMHEWLRRVIDVTATDPAERPMPRLITPSNDDLVLQQDHWPGSFKDAVLAFDPRLAGQNWRLYPSSSNLTITHQLRLSRAGHRLKVGRQLPLPVQSLAAQHLTEHYGDDWVADYDLDPTAAEAAEVLTSIRRALPG